MLLAPECARSALQKRYPPKMKGSGAHILALGSFPNLSRVFQGNEGYVVLVVKVTTIIDIRGGNHIV